jgi:hypothetical protein
LSGFSADTKGGGQIATNTLALENTGTNDHNGETDEKGGGVNVSIEVRVAKMESSVSHIERDMVDVKADIRDLRSELTETRITIYRLFTNSVAITITATLGLAALMAKGFGWI